MSAQDLIREAEDHMKKSVDACRRELATVRTGKATTALLDGVRIDYYGTPTPLKQIASVSAPEARLLTVQPFDKSATATIDKRRRLRPRRWRRSSGVPSSPAWRVDRVKRHRSRLPATATRRSYRPACSR